jgi:hypothetical protein
VLSKLLCWLRSTDIKTLKIIYKKNRYVTE